MASTALTKVGLGGVAQRCLNDGCVLMDMGRMVTLSGGVVASTVVGPAKVNAWIFPEVRTAEDGSDEIRVCACGACWEYIGTVCALDPPLDGLVGASGFDVRRWCEVWASASIS